MNRMTHRHVLVEFLLLCGEEGKEQEMLGGGAAGVKSSSKTRQQGA